MMDIDIFQQDKPNHEFYGYGDLRVGEMCKVNLLMHNKDSIKIQTSVHAYGQYTKKKFKTKALNNILYIKRVK